MIRLRFMAAFAAMAFASAFGAANGGEATEATGATGATGAAGASTASALGRGEMSTGATGATGAARRAARRAARVEDVVVVDRSEIIVVGHIKPGSLRQVEDRWTRTKDTRVVVVVSQVLKGATQRSELPVVIDGSLGLSAGRLGFDNAAARSAGPSGGSAAAGAGQECVWFLRGAVRAREVRVGAAPYAVMDEGDVASAALDGYFSAYLAPNREAALRDQIKRYPNLAARAQPFFDHNEVLRILDIKDADERAARLLPFYASGATWMGVAEAKYGLIRCGKAAGPYLVKVFDDPESGWLRADVIEIWGKIGWREAAERLAAVLGDEARFWAEREKARPAGEGRQGLTPDEARHYGELAAAVFALSALGDSSAADAIRATRRQWEQIEPDGEIVKACDKALAAIAEREAQKADGAAVKAAR